MAIEFKKSDFKNLSKENLEKLSVEIESAQDFVNNLKNHSDQKNLNDHMQKIQSSLSTIQSSPMYYQNQFLAIHNRVNDLKKMVLDQFLKSGEFSKYLICLLYTSPSPRDKRQSRMPSSA